MEALRALADRFRMSLTSTALRALLFVEQPCAFVLIKRGAIDWCACSEGWDVYLHRRAPVPARIDIEASRKGVTVPATAWGDGHEDALVKQFAIAARDEDVVPRLARARHRRARSRGCCYPATLPMRTSVVGWIVRGAKERRRRRESEHAIGKSLLLA